MGLDMSYQAIPADCDLIGRAKREEAIGELLCLVPGWFRKGTGPGRPWPEAESLWRQLCECAALHPGLAKRNYYLDRWWDKLHFVLSANRRREKGSDVDNLLDKAVRGASEIADHVRATQGAPVKYVAPEEVAMIGALLEPVTAESLRGHFIPAKMDALGVYKFASLTERDHEVEWSHLANCFAEFRTFYLEAARHGEGVIVCLD